MKKKIFIVRFFISKGKSFSKIKVSQQNSFMCMIVLDNIDLNHIVNEYHKALY